MVHSGRIPTRLLVAAAAVVLLTLAGRAASLPASAAIVLRISNTLHACYTPAGTMYLIMQPGLKQECSGKHELVTFNVEGPQGEQGIQGDKGDKGDTGDQGPVGPAGITGVERIETDWELGNATAVCPEGKTVLGGGGRSAAALRTSAPGTTITHGDFWHVANVDDQTTVKAYAICATVED